MSTYRRHHPEVAKVEAAARNAVSQDTSFITNALGIYVESTEPITIQRGVIVPVMKSSYPPATPSTGIILQAPPLPPIPASPNLSFSVAALSSTDLAQTYSLAIGISCAAALILIVLCRYIFVRVRNYKRVQRMHTYDVNVNAYTDHVSQQGIAMQREDLTHQGTNMQGEVLTEHASARDRRTVQRVVLTERASAQEETDTQGARTPTTYYI